jgi:hypothetical protein
MQGQWNLVLQPKGESDRRYLFRNKLRTFASGCTYCNPIPRFEKVSLAYRIVNLGFKDREEAVSTDLLARFWSFEHGFRLFTQRAEFGRHCGSRN